MVLTGRKYLTIVSSLRFIVFAAFLRVAKGKYVHVVEKVGKKVRIDDPVFGWIPSLKCTLERAPTYGKPLLAKFYE